MKSPPAGKSASKQNATMAKAAKQRVSQTDNLTENAPTSKP
jgi:hypothetical protein